MEKVNKEYEEESRYWESMKKKHHLPQKPVTSKTIPSVIGDADDDPVDGEHEEEHKEFTRVQGLKEYKLQQARNLLE